MTVREQIKERVDAFVNAMTGLGHGVRDKAVQAIFYRGRKLNDDELETLFQENWLAARVVEQPIEDALRQGFTVTAKIEADPEKSQEVASDIHDKLAELNANDSVKEAGIWGQLFGRAHVLVGISDGQRLDKPVNEASIKSVEYLETYDARDISPHTYYDKPEHSSLPKYGRPEIYRLSRQVGTKTSDDYVHESRLLTFGGVRSTARFRVRNEWRDPSALQRVNEVIRGYETTWQAVEVLMQSASQGVYKVQDLINMTSIPGGEEALATRMRVIDMARSVAKALVVDAERESFEMVSTSFAGIPEILDKFMLRLAGAANRPVTVLFGQAPAGLNATGESDIRLWNNRVQAEQRTLQPEIERLIELVCLAKDGPTKGVVPDRFEVVFPPLWTPTAKERLEMKKMQADIDAIYIDKEVVSPEEVALSRFRPEGWSDEMTVDLELRAQVQDEEAARLLEEAKNPPPPPPVPTDPNGPPSQDAPSDGEDTPAEAA